MNIIRDIQEVVSNIEIDLDNYSSTIQYVSHIFTLVSNKRHVVEDTVRYMSPYVKKVETNKADKHITAISDSDIFNKLKEMFYELKNLYSQKIILDYSENSFSYGSDAYNLLDANVLYILSQPENKVIIVTKSNIYPIEIIRLIRHQVLSHVVDIGSIHLHSAAVNLRGKGALLLTGSKGSGKTTTMLNLLKHGTCDFMTNDKVTIECQGKAIRVFGHPIAVGIRKDTLLMNDDFLDKFNYYFEYNHIEQDKVRIHHLDLAKIFSCDITTEASLFAIVVPIKSTKNRKPYLKMMSESDKINLIEKQLLCDYKSINQYLLQFDIFGKQKQVNQNESNNMLTEVCKNMKSIPAYYLNYNAEYDNSLLDIINELEGV